MNKSFPTLLEHYYRSNDELFRDVILWILTRGRASIGWPAITYLHQLCVDTGYSLEDQPIVKNDIPDVELLKLCTLFRWTRQIWLTYRCIFMLLNFVLFCLLWFCLFLWHINHYRLFNAKSILKHINLSISNNSVQYK